MIEVEAVSFKRGRTPVLHDINLVIPAGGITALVGPNGAGKSTLLALMARLLELQTGRIAIDGKSVTTTTSAEFARIVSVLRQDPNVSSRLTVRELIGFGRFPHTRGRLTAQDQRLIDQALDQFDLGALQQRFIDTLSGGQRQRALIAMTYCQGCGTMLLDEPLNNLDMHHARGLMQTLNDVAHHQGRTIVIVLHDINYAAAHAHRIVAMRDGRIVLDGETRNVLTPSSLEAVFGFKMDVKLIGDAPVVLHYK
jgi:iron complex transport system ATP-binding protein